MVTTSAVGSTGTRFFGGLLTAEMITVITDMRWMLLLIALCVVADFRYGWGESSKRYSDAKKEGNKVLMLQYEWRTSRAIRRSCNKSIDYLIWVAIGIAIGMALLEPVGVNHIYGGWIATVIAVICEAKSFTGHFFYLHGIAYEETTVRGFFRAALVALAKKKNPDLGEAIEEGFRHTNNDNNQKEDKPC